MDLNNFDNGFKLPSSLKKNMITDDYIMNSYSSMNWFSEVPPAILDSINNVEEMFARDLNTDKINLSIGVYRDENGHPYLPQSVAKAENLIVKQTPSKEYGPMEGFDFFRDVAAKFIYGEDSEIIENSRHATIQTLGGTGALSIGATFLRNYLRNGNGLIFVPSPTWGPHYPILEYGGFKVKTYRYWNPKMKTLDIDGLIEDIRNMPQGSVILLHAVAHNPVGVDPSPDQWRRISSIIKSKKIFPFFDCAYQGLSSGDIETDGYVVKSFANDGHQLAVALSFSKNMGLYGERIGALSIITAKAKEVNNVMTQLKKIIRPIYSRPAIHGARIVTVTLTVEWLKKMWLNDVKMMHERLCKTRMSLKRALYEFGSNINWNYMTDQIGIYWYSGLTPSQVRQLRDEFSIYVSDDGRINIAAITEENVMRVAEALNYVTAFNDTIM